MTISLYAKFINNSKTSHPVIYLLIFKCDFFDINLQNFLSTKSVLAIVITSFHSCTCIKTFKK